VLELFSVVDNHHSSQLTQISVEATIKYYGDLEECIDENSGWIAAAWIWA
jgi:hypothetical protein